MQKLIETGIAGGEHSEAHKAIVIGDTGGDPCHDATDPSFNSLAKLMTTISRVIIGIAISFHSF
jgi:Na+/H+-translocating membrane pyrophosphatase